MPSLVRPLAVTGLPSPLELHENPRTRRMTLRVDVARGVIAVVVPQGLPETETLRFVARHDAWIRARLAAMPPALPFVDGALVPLRGADHAIRHIPGLRGGIRAEDGEILVGGGLEFLSRRVADFLEAEARRELSARARGKAAELGERVAAVTVRDTRSRWGSCSAGGRLSFCWRLIMAPDRVLDYVVAHEVAHLREMNHQPVFWRLCARLTPEVEGPRAWLRANGSRLLRYGVSASRS